MDYRRYPGNRGVLPGLGSHPARGQTEHPTGNQEGNHLQAQEPQAHAAAYIDAGGDQSGDGGVPISVGRAMVRTKIGRTRRKVEKIKEIKNGAIYQMDDPGVLPRVSPEQESRKKKGQGKRRLPGSGGVKVRRYREYGND